MVFRLIHIIAISSSGFPTLADSGLDVLNDPGAWRGNRSGIVVKLAMKLILVLEGRINSRRSKNIQGEYLLWKE